LIFYKGFRLLHILDHITNFGYTNKMDSVDQPPKVLFKFRISSIQARLYQNVDFYLSNNLYQIYIKDSKQLDPDFKLLEWEEDLPIQCISFRNNFHAGCKIRPAISLDNTAFRFSFKGVDIKCKCTRVNHLLDAFCTHDSIENKEITFYFQDGAGLAMVPEFLTAAVNYTEKHIDNFGLDGAKVTVYCNDDGYWEKIHDRRKRNLSTVYLPKADKDAIVSDVEWFLKPETIARYGEIGRTHKRVYLFEGIPGSGKTSFILGLASRFGYDIATISFTEKVTDGALTRLLKNLPERTFLVMEDIDVLFSDRKKNDEHKNSVTFSGILNNLDGITTRDGFICFMTTNYKDRLDHALLRPGRVDKQLRFESATREQIHDIFERYMGTEFTEDLFMTFYREFTQLGFSVSMSLIQEFLFKYMDNPVLAVDNVEEIRELHEYNSKLSGANAGGMFI